MSAPAHLLRLVLVGGVATMSACGPRNGAVPRVDGPLVLEIRNIGDAPLNVTDSVALWGTVGTGLATLTVNEIPIEVAPNGGFSTLVPLPAGEPALLQLEARKGEAVVRRELRVARASAQAAHVPPPQPMRTTTGWVRLERPPSDTADGPTQARPIYSRWTPGGALAVALPQHTAWPVAAETDSAVRLRLSESVEVWVPRREAIPLAAPQPPLHLVGAARLLRQTDRVVVEVPMDDATATAVDVRRDSLTWTIYRATTKPGRAVRTQDPLIAEVVLTGHRGGHVTATMALKGPIGGWRVTHRDGMLRLEVRRRAPPTMAGLRVAIDAGHPPGGTTGPTGYREDSLTLAVAQEIARQLRALGATPILTRGDTSAVSLDARLARAEVADADLFVSLHADAPGDGRHASSADHTRVHWWHPHARSLAESLLETIPDHLAVPRDRVLRSNLAVLRGAWFPAALIEPTTLALPNREAALRTPDGVRRYASGVVAGIAGWVGRRSEPRL